MSMAGFDIPNTAKSFSIQLPAEALDERLFQLSLGICNLSPAKQQLDPTLLRKLDIALRLEQDRLMQIRENASDTLAAFRNPLLSFSNHLIILLHCRMLRSPSSSVSDDAWSKQCCCNSAQQVLALYSDFTHLPTFKPHRWYIRGRGAFHAFHAAVVLILLLSPDRRNSPSAEITQPLDNF
ncbi:hypothetical protein J3459_016970 [Metarhizium acridum]|nr:hypothetical protein J3459_016970 [Metarhizium acridum]